MKEISLSTELREYFQAHAEEFLEYTGDDEPEALPETGVLTGYALVCSWIGDDGQHWITYLRPKDQPLWATRGLLAEALHDLP